MAMFWKRTIGLGAGIFLNVAAISVGSAALSVPPGCPTYQGASGGQSVGGHHHTYYIDPTNGSMSGDGSKAHPWHTLGEVLDVRNRLVANAPPTYVNGYGEVQPNPNGPINSGDTLLLMDGNHGSVLLQGNFGFDNQLYGYNNAEFVTIAAAQGQAPVISGLTLKGVNKYLFRGITFQAVKSSSTSEYFLAILRGPNSNVVFDQNRFQSQADVSSWTTADWLSKRVSGITAIGDSCLSVTNNLFQNIGFAIASAGANNVLISHNLIDTFADDGIDFGSNNMIIDGNKIANSIEDGDGFHKDGIQGQPYNNKAISKVQITNNFIINQTKPLISPASLQGIDGFDGIMLAFTVKNNIVITNATHGITFYGIQNIVLANNTVIGTGSAQGVNTWINVNPSKVGVASTSVTVRNNISTYFALSGTGTAIDHNIIATSNPGLLKYFKPYPAVIAAVPLPNVFKSFNANTFAYDLRILNGAAVGNGTPAQAPPTDIRGLTRAGKIDLGAVSYGGGPVTTLQ